MAEIKTGLHYEEEGDTLIIDRVQDTEPVLKEVKLLKDFGGKSQTGELYHVGRIPAVIIEKYCNEVGVSFYEFLVDSTHIKRIVNDPDYKHFRVWEGTL